MKKDYTPNKVYLRTYCECDCDCPTCHDGEHTTKVEECAYCQLKWHDKGDYNPEYRKVQGLPKLKEITYSTQFTDDEILKLLIKEKRTSLLGGL